MPYIGNTIRAADDYRLIDDISSGFNGNDTTFALQVAGSSPVPFPKSPQQVLISVNGVIQEPDPTGNSGFNLVGTNIVFSSAPTNGHAFFGIIYATADYLNSGGNFPSGSLGAPSITFIGDENSGLYRKGSGSVGFVSDATEIANFDSNGITISSGNIIIPEKIIHSGDTNTFLSFPSDDAFRVTIGGAQRLDFGSSATVFNDDGGNIDFRVEGDSNASLFFVDASTDRIGIGTTSPSTLLHISQTNPELRIQGTNGSGGVHKIFSAGVNSESLQLTGASNLLFNADTQFFRSSDESTEYMRIDSNGRLLIGTTTEGHSNADDLTVNNSANCGITIRSGSSSDGNIFFSDATSGNGETRGVVKYKHADDALVFNSNGAERFRLDSSGRFLLGHNSDIGYGFRSQLVGTDGNTSSQAQIRFTNSASGPTFILAKSRNGTPGSKTIVNVNDNLGEIQFRGDDGVDYFGIAASIKTQIDGTPGAGDLPGRLVFSTTADGSDSATERMRISQSGDIAVNFDGSSQTGVFQIADGSASAPGLTFWADGGKDTGIFRPGANTIGFSTAATERMRIDSGGRLLHGVTTDTPVDSVAGAKVQVHNNASVITASFTGYGAHAGGSVVALGKSRSNTIGDGTGAVVNGDTLGDIRFGGSDGTDMVTTACAIRGEVDGSVSSNTIPGRLVFSINGTEQMRLNSSGQFRAGDECTSDRTSFRHQLSTTVNQSSCLSLQNPTNNDGQSVALGFFARNTNNAATKFADITCVFDETQANSTQKGSLIFQTNIGASSAERMRIHHNGNIGIGTSSPSYNLTTQGSGGGDGVSVGIINTGAAPAGVNLRSGHGNWSIYNSKTIGDALEFADESANAVRMIILNDGKVGIGTTSPAKLFEVNTGTSSDGIRITSDEVGVTYSVSNTGNTHGRAGIVNASRADSGSTPNLRLAGQGGIQFAVDLNSLRMTIDSSGNIGAPSGTNIHNASDERVKKNVTTLDKGLEAIKSLRPVSFNWIDGFCDAEKDTLYGFVAQEVQTIDPNLVAPFGNDVKIGDDPDNPDQVITDPLTVNEKFIIPMLVKAVQELSAKVTALESA